MKLYLYDLDITNLNDKGDGIGNGVEGLPEIMNLTCNIIWFRWIIVLQLR